VIGTLIDIQRVRQYFNLAARGRMLLETVRQDATFLDQARRGLLPLPFDDVEAPDNPFPAFERHPPGCVAGRRVAVVATGGSGSQASLVGVVRALEERGTAPVAYAACSGAALFAVPLAAGFSTDQVCDAVLALRPVDYLDPGWRDLAALPLRLGRGWAGLIKGEKLERVYREIVGDITLGELPIPVFIPLWNVEQNRLEYLGPDTHPDLPAARAVRMAVALPIAVEPVELDGGWWMDGGIVDILPAEPFVTADRCDLALVVNGFYPPGMGADEEPHWKERPLSLFRLGSQTRTMQHLQLARRSLTALREATDVELLEPVPYDRVHGAGLYGLFLDSREWATFMRQGYDAASVALAQRDLAAAS